MRKITLFFMLTLACIGCSKGPNETLLLASDNRFELWKTLAYYRCVDRNPEKYKAAQFLIENMKYHAYKGRLTSASPELERLRVETDSIYVQFSQGKSNVELIEKPLQDSLWQIQQIRRDSLKDIKPTEADVDNDFYADCNTLSFEFLREHIDHAFKVWKESPYAQNLSFDEFKEYILPYRSIRGYGFMKTGAEFNQLFSKYIVPNDSLSLRDVVQYYNVAVNEMRDLNGHLKRSGAAGIYDLYSRSIHGCVDVASYGCNILRSLGVPCVVEFNSCYRNFGGRHYHCSTIDTLGKWHTFNPESSLPGDGDWAFAVTLNVYRQLYGAQKDAPFFLKRDGEYVPSILDNPCIKDVTSHLKRTVEVELPFELETNGRLAYLGTYHKESGGVFPVTLGEIDTLKNRVVFKNAIPNMVYFPIYYPNNDKYDVFSDPFYISVDTIQGIEQIEMRSIPGTTTTNDGLVDIVINRKFPRKPNMIKVAEELVGAKFIGANSPDFSDAKVLYEIKTPPLPYFLTYRLPNWTEYKYYKFEASEQNPHANISMIEWLSSPAYGYSNSMKATPPHILSPKDTILLERESRYVKLLDSPTWEEVTWKSEYDGNMQTAPSGYRSIHFNPPIPCVATHVRFAPRNADNGVQKGDTFELFYWEDGWEYGGSVTAEYDFLCFNDIPANKLYWLVNKDRGAEELLFTLEDGKQQFLYYDMLK